MPKPNVETNVGESILSPKGIRFTIWDEPVAKERPRVGQHGNIYTPRKTKEWEEVVAWEAKSKRKVFDPELLLAIEVDFYVTNIRKADGDNLLKSLLDGIVKSGMVEDDSAFVDYRVRVWENRSHPRVDVWIGPVLLQKRSPKSSSS